MAIEYSLCTPPIPSKSARVMRAVRVVRAARREERSVPVLDPFLRVGVGEVPDQHVDAPVVRRERLLHHLIVVLA